MTDSSLVVVIRRSGVCEKSEVIRRSGIRENSEFWLMTDSSLVVVTRRSGIREIRGHSS